MPRFSSTRAKLRSPRRATGLSGIPGSQTAEVAAAVQGQRWLLIVDDIWEPAHAAYVNLLGDDVGDSRLLVTSRFAGIVQPAVEVPVGPLAQDDAVQLLFETAGVEPSPSRNNVARELVKKCGNLPLFVGMIGRCTSPSWTRGARAQHLCTGL